ncbi:alpha/beta fold hydrolase [Rhabdobacter roseus]|uniref:Pimeloyl-ACP methyl ester carboxylesterase n=1 Tax=Rhabdobacter roseus TaxID=1655419 RepID=A0A840U1M8_9BACT|nr:alpha/beta fold hydrolase [Rhabdobacter roseus]MBB5287637.1 pimeloyl-ACP methyl ester carboxylesterase [Rhabdobacter roseus]
MQLHYKKIGEGQPLLILHGVLGSLDNWLTVSKTIADAGYAVYLLDQRNHGRSPHHEQFDFTTLAADLEKFIAEHSLQNPILLGHSMGGKTVMQYAVTHPGTFAKLVVVDIGPKAYPPHHGELLRGLNALALDQIESRQQADELFSTYEPNAGVRQFLLKNLYRTDQGTFAWRFNLPLLSRDMKNVGDAIPASAPVTEPTLFMRGEKSDYILDKDWEAIQEQFPNARLETIAGAGHWVQAEQPKAFVAALLTFLEE